MDSVFHGETTIFKNTGQLAYCGLRLRGGETIAGYEYNLACVGELHRDVFESNFAHFALRAFAARGRGGAAERATQHAGDRTIHRAAHQDREEESREHV